MVGKFFLIALISVSLAQVRAGEMDAIIKQGLKRAELMYEQGQGRIDALITEAKYTSHQALHKADEYATKVVRDETEAKRDVLNAAADAIQQARAGNKTQAVFECIRKAAENGNKQLDAAGKNFEAQMGQMKKTAQENINAEIKAANATRDALKAKYEQTVSDIKNCKNAECVEAALNSFTKSIDSAVASAKQSQNKIMTIATNFEKEAKASYDKAVAEINNIKTSAIEAIKKCLEKKF